jgi:CheY-like chemotaxis protein
MTANAMKSDREACMAAGMDDYLAKPVRTAELVSALERCQSTGEVEESKEPAEVFRPLVFRETAAEADLAISLIDMFALEADPLCEQLKEGRKTRDLEALDYASHSLKSLVGNYGADRSFAVSKRFNDLIRSGELSEETDQLIEQLIDEIATLKSELEAYREKLI